MRQLIAGIGLALALAFATQPAFAQTPVDSYCAQISDNDKFASDGFALTDAGSILRQDRANYHRFGTPDADDYGDGTFTGAKARESIPAMLDRGSIDASLAREIVNGYPYVCVDIYQRSLTVYRGDAETSEGDGYDEYPFVGTWDCEVAVMSFSTDYYNAGGDEDLPILEIQEGTDGSYTLLFEDDYYITLSGFTGSSMGWFSGESGDSFNCTRLD